MTIDAKRAEAIKQAHARLLRERAAVIDAKQAADLLEKATPGPWFISRLDADVVCHGDPNDPGWAYRIANTEDSMEDGDAALIAAAPDLARAVIALTAERDRLRAALARAVIALTAERDAEIAENKQLRTIIIRTHDRIEALEVARDAAIEERDSLSARITTIADEACGMQPVQPADESLSLIESELFRLRQEREAAIAERNAAKASAAGNCSCGSVWPQVIAQRDAAQTALATARERVGRLEETIRGVIGCAKDGCFDSPHATYRTCEPGCECIICVCLAALADESEGT